ncbi:hypothetical protein L6164_037516 [Bauhinia variegata]|uniref:Uncharacterized protein n=1 Tax=Bauhinia variegata TaxID=167791 RepID=A0ACB9KK86_BAUVA|nr:hypothetical protein L6164_037516 [Bauhinia variegata]
MLLLLFQLQLQLLVSHSWSAVGCIDRERQALLDLKAGFVDESGLLSSWGNEEEKRDCCQWERVRCSNQTGHVQMLYLQGEDHSEVYWQYYDVFDSYDVRPLLRGKISASLMELQHLRYLNLSFNNFKYSHIPEFFGTLHSLRYLDVSNSYFVGKIPNQLGSLPNLHHLDLSRNLLEGAIPSQLESLLNLHHLDLSHNYLEGSIPSQLGNLSSLQKLYLGYNQALKIHNENFARTQWLSNLTSLTILDLSKVLNLNHSLNWLQTINELQNLRELYLVRCNLPDDDLLLFPDPSKFNFSSSLTIVDLSQVSNLNHSHYLLQIIGKLPNLRELFLGDCKLSDQDLFFLDHTKFNSSSLTTLDLSSNNMPATFLKSLANICTLRSLILSDVSLSVDFPTILHNLSGCASDTLQELDLRYCLMFQNFHL